MHHLVLLLARYLLYSSVETIKLIDTTLRDGEQTPGLSFSFEEKRIIADLLLEANMDEIEAGSPVAGKEQIDFTTYLTGQNLHTAISVWSRLSLNDVKLCAKTGADILHICVPASAFHIGHQIGSWSKIENKLKRLLPIAKDLFPYVSLGIQDTFRTDFSVVKAICSIAACTNVSRIRISDTVGYSLPGDVTHCVQTIKNQYAGIIDFHGHNDLGLAAANSLSALEAGADSVSVTVNGIGERAGNTALEQMCFILDRHPRFTTNIVLELLPGLCKYLSKISGYGTAKDKPITGQNVFTHESGIHVKGQLNNPLAYQPFNPEEKGLPATQLVVGTHSGRSSIIHMLISQGYKPTEKDVWATLQACKTKAAEYKRFLHKDEVTELYLGIQERSNEQTG